MRTNKTVKIWLITVTVLVVVGLVAFAGVMETYDWDFTRLNTVKYVTNTYEVPGEFDKISINVDTTKIDFVPAEDEVCSIVCYEMEKVKHSAVVQNGVLVIDMIDTRQWYDYICISFVTPKMTVYLPQNEFASLFIETDTGDVTIPKDFSFDSVGIDGDTSDVVCFASVSNALEIELSTGDIRADNLTAGQLNFITSTGEISANSVTVKKDIELETDTGDVNLEDVSCVNLVGKGDTGTIFLKNVVAADSLSVESDTGDVGFEDSDAAQIFVKTSTGDVFGTLLSGKVFITETSTGRIEVPQNTLGGKCEITTSTGDIELDVKASRFLERVPAEREQTEKNI